jgi:DNA-binding NarL/FixJ family response regulator
MVKRERKPLAWPANCPLNAENWSYLQRKYHFTPRELQIAIAVCRGCDNKKLAEHLDIEVNTAKVYLRIVYRKVGVDNKILLLLKFLEDIS